MAYSEEKVAAMVRMLVEPLVENKDALAIEVFSQDERTDVVEISVAESDRGKVIGRAGRAIKAVRTLVRASVYAKDKNILVELAED
ncbi:MAG: KH domain-containing protein [Eggerthellaceae bacterium]|nr:KH domain-containing protein [Eggerthellaceae bacterium]